MTTVQTVMLETLRISDIDPISPETAPLVLTITVFNDDVARDLSVRVNVTGERFGSLGFARKRLGPVAPHAVVTFTNRDFDSYNISMGADPLIDLALERGVLPADVYQFDVEVFDHTTLQRGVQVGEGEGFLETTNPGAQFDLLGPGTPFGQEPEFIANPAPLFQWTSEAQTFDFALYEVRPDQTSPEDVVTGRPVFSQNGITGNSFTYPNFAEALQPGTTYAWQLHARILTSGGIERLPSPVYWFSMEAAAAATSTTTSLGEDPATPPAPPSFAAFETTPGVAARLARIEIEPQEVTLAPGDLFQFRVTAYDTDEQVMAAFRPVWRLTPGFGGSMDDTGLFIAGERPGVVAIQVRHEDVSDFATVYIQAPELPVAVVEDAMDVPPLVEPPVPVDTAVVARTDSLATPRDTTGAVGGVPEAEQGVQVYLLLPTLDQQVFEPSPTFVWNVAGIDSAKVSRYRVSLWQTSAEQNPDVVPAEPPLWQGTVQGSTVLPYASDTQVLAPSQYYVAVVEALDAEGGTLARSEAVRFFMSPQGKMGWELLQAWDEAIRQGQADLSVTLLSQLQTATLGNADRLRLMALEVQLEIEDGPWLQFSVPFRRLEEVAALDFISILDLPAEPLLTAAGEELLLSETLVEPLTETLPEPPAPKATVRVAVMEFGFDEAAIRSMVTTQPLRFRSFRINRQIGGSTPEQARHGTATLRALLDYLPHNAELYLLNFSTVLEFRKALRYALDSLGVRVITCSVSWMDAYDHYDGSADLFNLESWLGDRAVLTTAAGNFARSHWEGVFSDPNGNRLHNFTPQQDYLELRLRNGVPYTFLLSWNDWQPPLRHDFDLALFDGQGRALRFAQSGKPVRSANRQVDYKKPVERIRNFLPPYPGTQSYRLQIDAPQPRNGSAPHLELYIYPAPEATTPAPMPGSSLSSGLATTRSRNIIPVTATGFAAASQGPTNDNRDRPDFSASGVVQLGTARLEGTSFATPRVAAAYTLIFTQHPDWTASQATTFLRRFARPGIRQDPQTGWGTIAFDELIAAL